MRDYITSIIDLDSKRFVKIIDKLANIPDEIKDNVPQVLTHSNYVVTNLTDDYCFVVFVHDKKEFKRIEKFEKQGVNPFPGLILPQDRDRPTAIALNRSRNWYLNGNKISNLYFLKLGKDCTVVIQNHKQSIGTKEFGKVDYTIDLAYLVSFGNEITLYNFYDYLDDLILFSLKTWGSS